jgi:hypothetical protein
MTEKLVRWAVFRVIIALVPLAFNLASMLTEGKLELVQICSRGELLLISAVISAGAIGEIIGVVEGHNIGKLFAGGACVITLFIASHWFATISTAIRLEKQVNSEGIAIGSVILFIITVIAGGCCVALSGVEKK